MVEARDIHFCMVEGRTIGLDLRRGRYFALPSQAQAQFDAMAGNHIMGTVSPHCLAELISPGQETAPLASKGGISGAAPPPAPDSDRSAIRGDIAAVPAHIALLALMAGLTARLLVRIVPLRWVLRSMAAHETPHLPMDDSVQSDRIAAAFNWADRLLGSEGQCLPRTLAFTWLCNRMGHHPLFIIGVRINPFSAHCWCQDGTRVLNDDLDAVRPYQPILVL